MGLNAQLAQLENAQLVRRVDEAELAYLFKHALTREAAYESLLVKKRREIHRRVAEAYERLYADQLDEQAAILAGHYAEAAESLVEALLRADETSSVDRLRRARVYMWIGRMHFYGMERRAALANFRWVLPIAQELKDEELGALASTLMARILLWSGQFSQALPLLQQGLAPLEQTYNWSEWIVTDSLLGMVRAAGGDYQAGVAEAEHALARAQDLHHLNGTAIAYALLAIIHLMGGAIQPMLDASRAGIQTGLTSENWLATYSAFGTQAWVESRLGQHNAARQSMAQAEAIAQRFGGRYLINDWLAAIKTEMALNAGQIKETLTRAEEAVTFARSVDGKFAEAMAQRVWGEALIALDPPRWEDAEAHLASSLELLDSGGATLEAARTHVAWGRVCQACGDWEAAHTHFEKAVAQFQASDLDCELEEAKQLLDSLST